MKYNLANVLLISSLTLISVMPVVMAQNQSEAIRIQILQPDDHSWWASDGQSTDSGGPQSSPRQRYQAPAKTAPAQIQARSRQLDSIAAVGLTSRDEVRKVQQALQSGGFYEGAIDGLPGPLTRSAIIEWQKSEGLSATGRLTPTQFASILLGTTQLVSAVSTDPEPALPAQPSQPLNMPTPTVQNADLPQSAASAGSRDNLVQADLEREFTSRLGPLTAKKIFSGNKKDILLFTNENPLAPHFMRRVTGDGIFRDDKMNVCLIGNADSLAPPFAHYALKRLQKLNPDVTIQNVPPWSSTCTSLTNSDQDDLFAVLREKLIDSPELQNNIATAITEKKIRFYDTINRGPFDALVKSQEDSREVLNQQLKEGTLNGFGLLADNSNNQTVCSTSQKDAEFVQRLVADIHLGVLVDRTPGPNPELVLSDIDDVFLRTKRGECGFILGDGPTLQLLDGAFTRDGFSMQLIPVIVPQVKADEIMAQIQTQRAVALAQANNLESEQAKQAEQAARERKAQEQAALHAQEQRKAELAQQARLDEIRRANDEAARIEELARIRSVVTSRGRAIQDSLDARIRQHINSVQQEVADTKIRARLGKVLSAQEKRILDAQNELDRLGQEFPAWSDHVLAKTQEEWTFGDIRASLEDYGQAKWRGRVVEAISVRVEFPMSNAIIGERTTDCKVFTWINDEEFQFWRQTFSIDCASYEDAFAKWSVANQFVSQWKLPPREKVTIKNLRPIGV